LGQGPKGEYHAHDDDAALSKKQRKLVVMVWRPCRCDLELKLDPFESLSFHQVLMDLKLTLDERVVVFPIEVLVVADEREVQL